MPPRLTWRVRLIKIITFLDIEANIPSSTIKNGPHSPLLRGNSSQPFLRLQDNQNRSGFNWLISLISINFPARFSETLRACPTFLNDSNYAKSPPIIDGNISINGMQDNRNGFFLPKLSWKMQMLDVQWFTRVVSQTSIEPISPETPFWSQSVDYVPLGRRSP